MTENDKKQIYQVAEYSPRSLWGYWPFIGLLLLVMVGVGGHVVLFLYFKNQSPGLEIWLREGDRMQPMWNSELVKRMVLTTSFAITTTFGLLAFLAALAHRYVRLLRIAATEMGIDEASLEPPERVRQRLFKAFREIDRKANPWLFVGIGVFLVAAIALNRIGRDGQHDWIAMVMIGAFFGFFVLFGIHNLKRKRATLASCGFRCGHCGYVPVPGRFDDVLRSGLCQKCKRPLGAVSESTSS